MIVRVIRRGGDDMKDLGVWLKFNVWRRKKSAIADFFS